MLQMLFFALLISPAIWAKKHHACHHEPAAPTQTSEKQLKISVTISARLHFVQVSWDNAPARKTDRVFLTEQDPHSFERCKGKRCQTEKLHYPPKEWISNGGKNKILAALEALYPSQWLNTGVTFYYALSRNVTVNTDCYGYWASYVDTHGQILAKNCLRAYPRWMNDMKTVVGGLRVRDLFIPGTHDSGCYYAFFDLQRDETLETKYTLTQDDTIRDQLMHGARYLDIRVGYYPLSDVKFYVNHGPYQQRILEDVIYQVKEFVRETNEIVIFGLKEFPVGFGENRDVHRELVSYLRQQFGDVIVHPSLTWHATLNDIWKRRKNVILAYDYYEITTEFPDLLFESVEQRWGNVQSWESLEHYLRRANKVDISRASSRPMADMAELTPDLWGIIMDKYGGLRKMADNVNWRMSKLYRDELGEHANIVAADFIRGTTLMETALDVNKRRKPQKKKKKKA